MARAGAPAEEATPAWASTRSPPHRRGGRRPAPGRRRRRALASAARSRHRGAAACHRGPRPASVPRIGRAALWRAQRSSGATRCRRNAGSSDGASAAEVEVVSAARNRSRSERRTVHRRGPALDARSSPAVIHRRTVPTVTCSSSATCAGVRRGSVTIEAQSPNRPPCAAHKLRRGEVSSPDGVDPEAWREEIRRQARQDKVRVTTYLSRRRRACVRDAQPHGRGRSSVRGQAAGA